MGAGTPAAGSVESRCPAVITIVQPVGLSVATPGMSSRWAGDFADLAVDLFPGQLNRALPTHCTARSTMAGLPNCGLRTTREIAHYRRLPGVPEEERPPDRFSRTVREKSLDQHEDLLRADEMNLARPNRNLARWLLSYTEAAARGHRPTDLDLRPPD